MTTRRYALRDDQWARIAHLLPGRAGHGGGTAAGNRLFADAVLYRYRAGIAWRDPPERFGRGKSAHRRFDRRARGGVRGRGFAALSADADNEYAMLDSTIVRARQRSAGARQGGAAARPSAGAGAGWAPRSTRWWTRRATRPPST